MLTIHKAVIPISDFPIITVPYGSYMLYAREQHNQMCVWYICDPSQIDGAFHLAVVGTGNPLPSVGRYLGSCHLNNGQLVFHVFEMERR